MKKYMLVVILLFVSSLAYSATSRPSAVAIEQWLRSQRKFKGVSVCTQQNKDGNYEITKWEANGVKQPTDVELEKIIDDYGSLPPEKSPLELRLDKAEADIKTLMTK